MKTHDFCEVCCDPTNSCPTFCTTLVTTPISALPHKRPGWVVSQPRPPPPPLQLWKYLPPTNRPFHSSGLSTHQHLHQFSVGSISNTCIEIRGGRVESFTSHHPFTSHQTAPAASLLPSALASPARALDSATGSDNNRSAPRLSPTRSADPSGLHERRERASGRPVVEGRVACRLEAADTAVLAAGGGSAAISSHERERTGISRSVSRSQTCRAQ